MTQTEFREKYTDAVNQIRDTGIHVPLVIDADQWGRNGDALLENGPHLVEQDPNHNLIFSWHLWDPINWGNGTQTSIRKFIDGSIEKDICLIVGEFGPIEFGDNPNSGKINWEYLIEYAAEKEIGWLAWVWNWEDYHSIVKRSSGKYNDWANPPWGEQVAVASPYSIQKTSKRPNWLESGVNNMQKIPSKSSLQHNYPNPFNLTTSIEYEILEESMVRLIVFNILGNKIKTLISKIQKAGDYAIQWDAIDEEGFVVPSGIYYYSIVTDRFHQTNKMVLQK